MFDLIISHLFHVLIDKWWDFFLLHIHAFSYKQLKIRLRQNFKGFKNTILSFMSLLINRYLGQGWIVAFVNIIVSNLGYGYFFGMPIHFLWDCCTLNSPFMCPKVQYGNEILFPRNILAFFGKSKTWSLTRSLSVIKHGSQMGQWKSDSYCLCISVLALQWRVSCMSMCCMSQSNWDNQPCSDPMLIILYTK